METASKGIKSLSNAATVLHELRGETETFVGEEMYLLNVGKDGVREVKGGPRNTIGLHCETLSLFNLLKVALTIVVK